MDILGESATNLLVLTPFPLPQMYVLVRDNVQVWIRAHVRTDTLESYAKVTHALELLHPTKKFVLDMGFVPTLTLVNVNKDILEIIVRGELVLAFYLMIHLCAQGMENALEQTHVHAIMDFQEQVVKMCYNQQTFMPLVLGI